MSAMGAVALTSRVVSGLRDSRLISSNEYFEKNDWVQLPLYGFEAQAWRFALSHDGATALPVPSTYVDEQAFIVDGLGVELGFSISGGVQGQKLNHRRLKADSCWVRKDGDVKKAKEVVGRGLWEMIGTAKAILVKSGDGIGVMPDDDEETLPSRKGDEVYAKLKRYLDKGTHRSVFMIGEAGVGKSHMLRYIAQKNGGLILRVKIADLEEISPTKMIKTVELLRPDVLIIDDFDRFVMGSRYSDGDGSGRNARKMLDPLQQINRMVKLFMVSANYSESINEAVLRPGRFDEVLPIHELDPEIYERLLPDAPAKLIKELKKQAPPVAYIAELKKRVDVLGYEEAAKEMEELVMRSGRILELNKTAGKPKRRRRSPQSLVGKSKLKQAMLMEKRAAKADKAALRAKEDAFKAEQKAKEWREKAGAKRSEAEADKEAASSKGKPAKSAKPKKKGNRKAKKKSSAKVAAEPEPAVQTRDRPLQSKRELRIVRRTAGKVTTSELSSLLDQTRIRRRRHRKTSR
jgi:hypothetical protein